MPDFNGLFGQPYKPIGVNNLRRGLLRRILNSQDGKVFAAKVNALVGATPGTNQVVATRVESLAQRPSTKQAPGGDVPIVTKTLINRPSNAADVAEIKAALVPTADVVFAKDRSGNGGGGKIKGF